MDVKVRIICGELSDATHLIILRKWVHLSKTTLSQSVSLHDGKGNESNCFVSFVLRSPANYICKNPNWFSLQKFSVKKSDKAERILREKGSDKRGKLKQKVRSTCCFTFSFQAMIKRLLKSEQRQVIQLSVCERRDRTNSPKHDLASFNSLEILLSAGKVKPKRKVLFAHQLLM